jgi:bifunctional non-homologous end joining protein LigD
VRVVTLPSPGSSKNRENIDYVVVEELAALVWTGNLAALELHTHMWRVSQDDVAQPPDIVVFDLDPGPPATIVECCQVAQLLRPLLEADGLEPLTKTSGSKGLQLYARADRFGSAEETSAYAKSLAQRLDKEQPELVVHRMTKSLRDGKVLVDWSQNSAAKTTVSVYSLRAKERPTVSTPVTWEEVAACRRPSDLVFTSENVLARVEEHGDLFAPLL